MTPDEILNVAPNLNWALWRVIICEPPLLTMHDLRTWATIDDLMDAHEALNYKAAQAEKSAKAHKVR